MSLILSRLDLRPGARRRHDVLVHRPREVEAIARALVELGYGLEIVVARDGAVIVSVGREGEDALAEEAVAGGLGLYDAIDRGLMTAYVRATRGADGDGNPFEVVA
jgi:hypothetical protein